MALDVNSINGTSSTQGPASAKKAEMKQKFDTEKTAALSAAHGKTGLLAQINAVTEHKGAIQELEALMLQATQSNANPAQAQQRTIGIG